MDAPVSEGDIVLDKYRVERVLGKGGMGVVVAATHVDLDQKVALKFLLPSALEHPEIVERFAREAKAAAKIQSQHVVRVLDTGRMPSGAPFMVMEYLEGEDLGQVLKHTGPLSPNVVADYVLQACEAVGEAHAAGIVHRDLKPSNLFLAKQRDRRSIVKVLDFGISKLEEPDAAPLTRTATAMGSPHYMSPEQLISSKNVDARSDIWSLGVILYELLAGTRPFEGETMPEVIGQVLNNQPVRLAELCEGISLDLELLVARCLATAAKDRYQTVADLAAALGAFATDEATASASVERITRVLGGASIPPAARPVGARAAAVASAAGTVITIDVPEPKAKGGAGDEVAVTARPAAAAPAAADDEVESMRELALASTTPSTELSGAVEAVRRGGAERPGSRRGLVVVAGIAACVLAIVGLRAASSRTSGETTAERAPPASEGPLPSAPPHRAASAAEPVATAAPSAGAAPEAPSAAAPSATTSAAVIAPLAVTTVRHAARPGATAQAQAPAPAASARPQAPRDTLHMDIK